MLDHGVVHGQLTHFSTGDYDAGDAPSSSLSSVVFVRRRCVPETSQSVSVISSEFESSTTPYCCTVGVLCCCTPYLFNVCSRPLLTSFLNFTYKIFQRFSIRNRSVILEPCLCFCDICLHFGIFDLEKKCQQIIM